MGMESFILPGVVVVVEEEELQKNAVCSADKIRWKMTEVLIGQSTEKVEHCVVTTNFTVVTFALKESISSCEFQHEFQEVAEVT